MHAVRAQSGDAPVEPHLLSLLLAAPELAQDLSVPAEIAAALACSREGNARDWTRRIAHGIVDFLCAVLRPAASIVFCNVDQADPTDREFITLLQRRAASGALSVQLVSDTDASPVEDASIAPRAFLAAYGPAVPDGETALLLGASDRCMHLAYYDAALEWAGRGQARVDPVAEPELYGKLTRNMVFALLLLGRYEETEALCAAAQDRCSDPALSSHIAYARAILNARFYTGARRDYDAARSWVQQSQAFSDRAPVSESRAVNHAFLMNTMALVEMRKGHDKAALDLLDAALAYMAKEAPGRYALECGILLHNRARLHVAAKRNAAAIGDLTRLLEVEPFNGDAYFDRGLLQQRAGRYDAALADYDSAISWTPPYWQPHFNRAQVLTALGREVAAVADYDRVLALQPEHLDTLINRGNLHLASGNPGGAERDAAAALGLDGANARALCLRGLVAIRRRDFEAADQDFSMAIAVDPQLADAWANRATVHFKLGRLDAALADIDQALALREDADILYNRGRILERLAGEAERRARL